MIPRIIHTIWIGDKKMPNEVKTWDLPGWEHKIWTEKDINSLDIKNRKIYDYFYNKKVYHGCSDVARIEILEKYGGIYIDADTERTCSLEEWEEADFLQKEFFTVNSNKVGRIANGIIGCTPGHTIIKQYIKEMGEAKEIEPAWSTIGGTLFTKIVYFKSFILGNSCAILPPHTFYPFDSKGKPSITSGKSYAKHYWKSTHRTYENK